MMITGGYAPRDLLMICWREDMMADMGRHDDEFDEFDVPAEEIQRVIDEGEPVEFGDNVVIRLSTLPWVGTTASLGQADQLHALEVATG
jgi:hypothetical protein